MGEKRLEIVRKKDHIRWGRGAVLRHECAEAFAD